MYLQVHKKNESDRLIAYSVIQCIFHRCNISLTSALIGAWKFNFLPFKEIMTDHPTPTNQQRWLHRAVTLPKIILVPHLFHRRQFAQYRYLMHFHIMTVSCTSSASSPPSNYCNIPKCKFLIRNPIWFYGLSLSLPP